MQQRPIQRDGVGHSNDGSSNRVLQSANPDPHTSTEVYYAIPEAYPYANAQFSFPHVPGTAPPPLPIGRSYVDPSGGQQTKMDFMPQEPNYNYMFPMPAGQRLPWYPQTHIPYAPPPNQVIMHQAGPSAGHLNQPPPPSSSRAGKSLNPEESDICTLYCCLCFLGCVFPPAFLCGSVGVFGEGYWEQCWGWLNVVGMVVTVWICIAIFG